MKLRIKISPMLNLRDKKRTLRTTIIKVETRNGGDIKRFLFLKLKLMRRRQQTASKLASLKKPPRSKFLLLFRGLFNESSGFFGGPEYRK